MDDQSDESDDRAPRWLVWLSFALTVISGVSLGEMLISETRPWRVVMYPRGAPELAFVSDRAKRPSDCRSKATYFNIGVLEAGGELWEYVCERDCWPLEQAIRPESVHVSDGKCTLREQ